MLDDAGPILDTTGGEFRLEDYRLRSGGREWSAWHTGAVLTDEDEARVIGVKTNRLPYGVALWPSGIALAHEVAARVGEFRGRRVLELGAGLGLPGIVAAGLGASVVQTDRDELALHLARRNAERNEIDSIDVRLADWTVWEIDERFDLILGADILYGPSLHANIRGILARNLAPEGRALIADPFRPAALRWLEALEAEGWGISFSRYEIGDAGEARPVGVFELVPPA